VTSIRLILYTLGALVGIGIGGGLFTFVYARGGSYLSADPAACANCHIMQEHYAAWTKSSHRVVAGCNDCHTPADFIGKYSAKASNGFWHSLGFTTGDFPDPLRIKPSNRAITEAACRSCHEEMVSAIDHGTWGEARSGVHGSSGELSCIHCHKHVGHWVR